MRHASATSNQQHPAHIHTKLYTYDVVLVVQNDIDYTDTLIKLIILGEDFGLYVPNIVTKQ